MMFQNIPILRAAGSCGIQYDQNTVGAEVRAQCPFCNDSKKRLYLNTEMDVFHCQHCKKSGNSITLYADLQRYAANAGTFTKTQAEPAKQGAGYVCDKTERLPFRPEKIWAALQ